MVGKSWQKWTILPHFVVVSCFLQPLVETIYKKKKEIKQDFTPRWIWRLSLSWSQASCKEIGVILRLKLFFVAPLLNLCLKKTTPVMFSYLWCVSVFHHKLFVIVSKNQRLFASWASKTRPPRFDNLSKTRRYTTKQSSQAELVFSDLFWYFFPNNWESKRHGEVSFFCEDYSVFFESSILNCITLSGLVILDAVSNCFIGEVNQR